MKALKTKVILSAVVLLFALVATIGSTFAWFTVTNTVDVTTPTLQIQAVDSLLIKIADANAVQADSVDNDDPTFYSQSISAADIIAHTDYTLIEDWTLYPVSTVQSDYASSDAGALTKLGSTSMRVLTALETTDYNHASTGSVIRLKFWLMAQSDDNIVKVNNVVIAGQSGGGVDALIEGSARLAVTRQSDSVGFIYGNSSAIDYDFSFLGTANEYTEGGIPASGFNTLDQRTTDLSSTLENDVWESGTNEDGHIGVQGDSGSPICELDTLLPILVVVDIFIEGWDANTTGDIIAGLLNVTFDFTIA